MTSTDDKVDRTEVAERADSSAWSWLVMDENEAD